MNREITEKEVKRERKKGTGPVRGDLLLLAGVLLFSLFFWLAVRAFRSEGEVLSVSVDGEERMTFDLDPDLDYLLETEYGSNRITIQNGEVSCAEADCPDKICVKHSAISAAGETIICLPHKLVLEVKGR